MRAFDAKTFAPAISWAKKHERQISALSLAGGFAFDSWAFGSIEHATTQAVFIVYLLVTGISIAVLHVLESRPDGRKPTDKTRTILVVSEKGYGKRTFLDDPETGEPNYRITNRGGKGVKTINVTEKTGSLVGLLDVTEKEDLMITCVSGITIRMSVSSVSEQGRATQGVKLIRVDDGDEIAAITKLDEKEEEIEVAVIKEETNEEGVIEDTVTTVPMDELDDILDDDSTEADPDESKESNNDE